MNEDDTGGPVFAILAPNINPGWGRWLRNQANRTGAVFYYLHAVMGYSPTEIATAAPALAPYQVEELALLGILTRHQYPEKWRSLIR